MISSYNDIFVIIFGYPKQKLLKTQPNTYCYIMLSPNLTSKFVFSSSVVLTFIQVRKLQNSIQEYNHQLYNVLRDVKKKMLKIVLFFYFILILLIASGYLVSQGKMMFEQ